MMYEFDRESFSELQLHVFPSNHDFIKKIEYI